MSIRVAKAGCLISFEGNRDSVPASFAMRSAYEEIMATSIKRQFEPPRIVGDLLQSEIAKKQTRSIKYQLTVAKLPLAKDKHFLASL